MGGHEWNCSDSVGKLKQNDDIDGLGVVLGFGIMAYISVVLLIAYYFIAFDPNENPFHLNGEESEPERTPNPVDLLVFRILKPIRKRFIGERHDREKSVEAFYKCILMVADTQLVTGIAISISGYYSLTRGLATYYWQTLVYLIWFACLTHLSALTCLRSYLHQHQRARTLRLFLMSALLLSLFAGFIPMGHFNFISPKPDPGEDRTQTYIDLGDFIVKGSSKKQLGQSDVTEDSPIYVYTSSPAICYFKGGMQRNTKALLSMVFSHLLLVYGYVIRISKLFKKFSIILSIRVHENINKTHQSLMDRWERHLRGIKSPTARIRVAAIFLPLQASLYFLITMLLDIYCSMLLEIISLIVSASWGTIRLYEIRKFGPKTENNSGDNLWAFGQVLPLVLLALPVLSIYDFMHDYFFPHGVNPRNGYSNPANAFPIQHETQDGEQRYSEVESVQQTDVESVQQTNVESIELQMHDPEIDAPPPTTYNNPDGYNDHNQITERLVHSPPYATPGSSRHEEKLQTLLQLCRDGYPGLFGWSPLLVPFPTTLWLAIIFLDDGTKIIAQNPHWVAFRMLVFYVVWPLCYCQVSIHSLFYLEGLEVRKRWKHLIRFATCCGFTAVPIVCYLIWPNEWVQQIPLAAVFGGFHITVVFFWSVFCF